MEGDRGAVQGVEGHGGGVRVEKGLKAIEGARGYRLGRGRRGERGP
jgi:hypothetical protein